MWRRSVVPLACVLGFVAVLLAAGAAHAQETINDGPASFSLGADHFIDASADLTGVSATLTSDFLFAEGWWYRVAGDEAETFLPEPDGQDFAGTTATLTWSDIDGRGLFRAVETITISNTGGPSGRVTLSLAITNLSDGDPLAIDVFHMADIDVAGSLDDTAVLKAGGVIGITDGANGAEYFAPDSSAFLVTPSGDTGVSSVLFNAAADDFTNTGLPFGPGDVTAGFQWKAGEIAPSGTQKFTAVIAANTTAIPGGPPASTTTSIATGPTTTTTQPAAATEACDDCQDNDGDGLVDFEDPDCCATAGRGTIALTKGKLKRRGMGVSVAFGGTLPPDVIPASPATVAMTIQLARAGEGELFCARIPSATLQQRKGQLVFRGPIGVLDRVTVRGKAGAGRLVAQGKTVPLELPASGPLTVTFGLRAPADAANRCAIGTGEFAAKRKALVLH